MIKIPDDWVAFAKDLFGPSAPQIRPMTAGDLDEVLRIIRLHDSDDYAAAKRAFSQTSFDLDQGVGAHFVILHPEDSRVVGVTGYYIDDLESQGIYWLGWTYVNPFNRGEGFGGMLLHFVIRTMHRFGARKLYLSTSSLPSYAKAIGFYEHYGFEHEALLKDYFVDGEDKVIMALRLS